jgi:hypothetical protein
MLAWVALWRPGALLLAAWHPLARDAILFSTLERADMHVTTAAKETRR